MRLTNLIVLVWRYKQELQKQYENALPHSCLDHDALAQIAELPLKTKDDKIDYGLTDKDIRDTKINPLQRDEDGHPVIKREGAMPPGGRRHNGVLAFEWLANRLLREGIDLGLELSEYAALDDCFYSEVSMLSAELLLEDHDLNNRIAADREWVKRIEDLPHNEQLAAAILDELSRQFAFSVAPEPEPQPKLIGVEVIEPIPQIMPKSEELEVIR